jgi:hypothetical protein
MNTSTPQSAYDHLVQRLGVFVSSYYLQQILKGLLMVVLTGLSFYLIGTTLEYNLYLGSSIRRIIFWGSIFTMILQVGFWVLRPLAYYYNTRKRIDQKTAAKIIGQHFPQVQDKLLNILFLREMYGSHYSNSLIEASIDQKSKNLALLRFGEAIDWAINKKLLRYFLYVLLGIFVVVAVKPAFFSETTYRLINYDQTFTPKAPFDFILLNSNLKVQQYDNLQIRARLQGKSLPDDLAIEYLGVKTTMNKMQNGMYEASLQNIEKSGSFRLLSAGFFSDEYKIDVVPKPFIKDIELTIISPAYTGIETRVQKNIGDISAPEGSMVLWRFQTDNVDKISIVGNNNVFPANKYSNAFGLKLQLKKINSYTIISQNNLSPKVDTQHFAINLLPDAHPTVSVNEFSDSVNDIKYYVGDVSDDYGVNTLWLKAQVAGNPYSFQVQIPRGKNASFQFSTKTIFSQFPKGAEINYYFEVYDNDAVNGSKSSRSSVYSYKKLTEKEIERTISKNSLAIQSQMKDAIKEAKQIQKELEALRKKMLEKNQLDFNDKKQLEELIAKQKEMQSAFEKLQKEIERNFDKKNELKPQDQAIKDQQKQMNDIINQMKSQEYENLLNKIEKLMNNQDKKEMMNDIQKMDNQSEKMEKNMDRLLQLYKNLDYKQKVDDLIGKLDKLAKNQEKLSLETELNQKTKDEQKGLKTETSEAKKTLEEIKKLNEELHKTDKKDFDEIQKDLDGAMEEQEKAEENLSKNNKEKAEIDQKEAKNKLSDARDKLKKLKKKQKANQKKEDIRTIRRILENVMHLSFEQEKLVALTRNTTIQSPSYPKLFQIQKKLLEDFRMVEDSLYKVASRQSKLKKFIFTELEKINDQSNAAIYKLTERRPNEAVSNEQFAMTAYNNLGLSLSESLKNIEDEESDGPESDEQCDNPKSGKKKKKKSGMSMEKLAEMQSQLNEQMEQLQKKMQEKANGKKEGDNGQKGEQNKSPGEAGKEKSGKEGSQSGEMDAKEIAKIVAQQQALRNALQKLENEKNEPDKSGRKPFGNNLNDVMDKMEQTERELVNRKLYQETLKRQKEIQIKLLESAKAEKEQDQEERRESERAKNIPPPMPNEMKKYLEDKKKNQQQIQRTPVGLSPYYKTLTEKYFQLIR